MEQQGRRFESFKSPDSTTREVREVGFSLQWSRTYLRSWSRLTRSVTDRGNGVAPERHAHRWLIEVGEGDDLPSELLGISGLIMIEGCRVVADPVGAR
ncbi:hypothetical protein JNB88_21985 [Rhizobium cauense]|uniref:hypothetical protein n=1 Tax=Rhizobium cauense TaxID=1166683 RepID=UPI001C6E5F5A|nr:hypothetical protein [Rhizobium cauense]